MKKRKAFVEESDLLIRLSALIDRLMLSDSAEFEDRDIEMLRAIERYLCEQIVTHKLAV